MSFGGWPNHCEEGMLNSVDHRRLRYLHADGTVRNPDEVEGRDTPISKEDVINLKIALETEESFEKFLERT